MRDELKVTEQMLDALFKAVRATAKPNGQLVSARHGGLRIILDGTAYGLLTIDTRCSAFVSLLAWCQEEEEELGDFALELL